MTPADLARIMETTWPPARSWRCGPFTLRDGAGGGKRVSAATSDVDPADADLSAAEAAMADPIFAIREGDEALDAMLDRRGYRMVDPVVAYAAPIADLSGDVPHLGAFTHWPPLEIARSIWRDGGIGVSRVRVMDRVEGPKAAVLARIDDRPVGVAFVAVTGPDAMMHAIEVRMSFRRQGAGKVLVRAAANFAAAQGATRMSLVVTKQNVAARALYARAGMQVVGHYHYRTR